MSALVVPQEDIFLEFTKWEMILALFYSNKRIGLVKTCCSSKKLLLSTPWHKKKKKRVLDIKNGCGMKFMCFLQSRLLLVRSWSLMPKSYLLHLP